MVPRNSWLVESPRIPCLPGLLAQGVWVVSNNKGWSCLKQKTYHSVRKSFLRRIDCFLDIVTKPVLVLLRGTIVNNTKYCE